MFFLLEWNEDGFLYSPCLVPSLRILFPKRRKNKIQVHASSRSSRVSRRSGWIVRLLLPQNLGRRGSRKLLLGLLLLPIEFLEVFLQNHASVSVDKEGQSLFEHFVGDGSVPAQRLFQGLEGFVFGRQRDQIPDGVPQIVDRLLVVSEIGFFSQRFQRVKGGLGRRRGRWGCIGKTKQSFQFVLGDTGSSKGALLARSAGSDGTACRHGAAARGPGAAASGNRAVVCGSGGGVQGRSALACTEEVRQRVRLLRHDSRGVGRASWVLLLLPGLGS